MPSYDVLVTQDITQSTTIRIEADDPDQAAEKALSKARAKGYELDWTLSDGPCSDPYLGDDEEAALENNSVGSPDNIDRKELPCTEV